MKSDDEVVVIVLCGFTIVLPTHKQSMHFLNLIHYHNTWGISNKSFWKMMMFVWNSWMSYACPG